MGDCEIVTTVIFVVGVVTIVSFALAVYTQVELSGLAHDGTTVLEHHDQQIKKGIKVIARHDEEIKELQQTVSIELLPALSQLQAYLGTTTTTTPVAVKKVIPTPRTIEKMTSPMPLTPETGLFSQKGFL